MFDLVLWSYCLMLFTKCDGFAFWPDFVMLLFVVSHKVWWFCVLTWFCDVIVCCCSQRWWCSILALFCDVNIWFCSQSLMVLCFDFVLWRYCLFLLTKCNGLVFWPDFVMLLFVFAHHKVLISTMLYIFYDFMKYTALLNVLISSVLLPLWWYRFNVYLSVFVCLCRLSRTSLVFIIYKHITCIKEGSIV